MPRPPKKPSVLRQWIAQLAAAGVSHRLVMLAKQARTTREYLYHVAAGPSAKRYREPSPDLAARVEKASADLHRVYGHPPLLRTDLSSVCRACPYAQRCLGSDATRTDL